jgi:hypothetical protein
VTDIAKSHTFPPCGRLGRSGPSVPTVQRIADDLRIGEDYPAAVGVTRIFPGCCVTRSCCGDTLWVCQLLQAASEVLSRSRWPNRRAGPAWLQ